MSKTVLVIDDELGYWTLLSLDLSKLGYVVLTAASGLEALKIMGENSVDLIISDMKMSPMDGLDTITAIRKTHPTIPFVIITGYAIEERVQQAMRFTPSTCLHKPFAINDMRHAVSTLVGASA